MYLKCAVVVKIYYSNLYLNQKVAETIFKRGLKNKNKLNKHTAT